jgi:predicted PurR-regulated permease PerM
MTSGKRLKHDMKERMIPLIVIMVMFITIWYMLDIVLLTFIIAFVFYHLVARIQRTRSEFMVCKIPDGFVLSVLYIFFVMILTFASIVLAPKLAEYFTNLAELLATFNIDEVKSSIDPRFAEILDHVDLNKYLVLAGGILASGITKVGGFGVNFFLSLILSYLLLLEKKKIRKFGEKLEDSRISFIYDYWIRFGSNFCKTFGKVMKVQVTIALINSIISMIILMTLGFPQVMILGIMIFTLGLIPVAGAAISLVPLSIIAFNIGGIGKVIAVILMILLIHAIEAYILNPKLMSDQTELPVCFIFIILLVGEHYLGVWGLLIGVPIFIFLMNALEVDYSDIGKPKGGGHKYKVQGKHEDKESAGNQDRSEYY